MSITAKEERDALDKMRRSLGIEIVRMEDDFDETRAHRKIITDKLMAAAVSLDISKVDDDTDGKLKIINGALKALAETESAAVKSVSVKLKNQEQELAADSSTADRIQALLMAAHPATIRREFPIADLDHTLETMFAGQIADTELKENPNDLSE